MDWTHFRWVFFYLSPAPLLGYSWRSWFGTPDARRAVDLIPLAIGTISQLWIASIFITSVSIGPDYGDTRFWILCGNLLAVSVTAIFSLVSACFPGARWQRVSTGLACLFLTLYWLITAAANAAV